MFRVHVVCEGPSDFVVIEAALKHHLEDFVMTQIQPERSLFGGDQGPLGGGWKGVKAWCRQTAEHGGIEASGRLANADLFILHVDADVAAEEEIACARPCPPPSPTVNALRKVVLSWLGEQRIPARVIFCIPSKAMDSWVLAGLHPDDDHVVPCDPLPIRGWCLECRDDPASLLIGKPTKLVRKKQGKLKKMIVEYKKQGDALTTAWPRALEICVEARRFDQELKQLLPG